MSSTWLKDAAERIVRTFLSAFIGIYVASGINLASSFTNLSVADKAAGAGIAAALQLILSLLGGSMPSTLSPASLVKPSVHWSGKDRVPPTA